MPNAEKKNQFGYGWLDILLAQTIGFGKFAKWALGDYGDKKYKAPKVWDDLYGVDPEFNPGTSDR